MRKIIILISLFSVVSFYSYAQVARELKVDKVVGNELKENTNILMEKYNNTKSNPSLSARGNAHFYEDEYLDAIQFPVGGIGGGCIQYNGDAVPRFWQIFNNMTHDFIPNSFMAVRVKHGDIIQLRALQTTSIGELKGMKSLKCKNEFPFLEYIFEDELAVNISLKVYNPFVPLNLEKSSIPAAFYQITIENKENFTVEIDLLASQQNAVGFSKVPKVSAGDSFAERYEKCLNRNLVQNNISTLYGGNINSVVSNDGAKILLMESSMDDATNEHFGQMALMLMDSKEQLERTEVSSSWNSMDKMLTQFEKNGEIKGSKSSKPSKNGTTYSGAITSAVTLKAGETKTFNLALVWYFPNGKNGGHMPSWDGWGKGKWEGNGNNYANYWSDINELTAYISDNFKDLYSESRDFQQSFFQTNLPYWLVERLSSQLSILKSRTMFHDKNGYVGLWEGCGAGDGSCAGNCNHVWHYAQAHARLFPDLARAIREQGYKTIKADGQIPYRQPAGSHAFDGQCGDILSTYREHLITNDSEWLKELYPNIKKAIGYLITTWDKDEDGWLNGSMHTTYDCGMSGNASFLTSLFLATLKAGVEMGTICGDMEQAVKWKALYEKAAKVQNQRLWNGEYYIQIPDSLSPASDYKNGCHTDQLLGQWWADQLDLGDIFPVYRTESAFNSILKYNFKSTLEFHKQAPRTFAKSDEPALIVTTWPNGDRPTGAPGYSDEIWAAYEYNLAASLFKQNQPLDALTVLYAGVKRYDGKLRTGFTDAWGNFGFSGNPFGDDECGQFYSRSLCQWSVLLAVQGFGYNGPKAELSFSPKWKKENHNSFFSTAEGWGNFTQKQDGEVQSNTIEVKYGVVKINTLELDNLSGVKHSSIDVLLNDKPIDAKVEIVDSKVKISFKNLALNKTDKLNIKLK